MTVRMLVRGGLGAFALIFAPLPAAAQSSGTPPTEQQKSDWAQQLGRYTMASTWLRRCPTEYQFRQRAAQTAEQVYAEYFHAAGMPETTHQQGKKLGREAAYGPCTDKAKAGAAGRISAQAFLILTANTPDLGSVAQNFLLTGSIDDSPCGVARGRMFGAMPNQKRISAEIERAKAEAGALANEALADGAKINGDFSDPKVCEIKKGWIPIILSGWSDTYAGVQDFTAQVQSQEYGSQNSWIWRVKGQRSDSIGQRAGVYVPCRTHTPWLDQMTSNYNCELMVLAANQRSLVAVVGPVCAKEKCLKEVRKVELQLFTDPKAPASKIFTARSVGEGKFNFGNDALKALLDPNEPAKLAQVIVGGVNADGKVFADGFPLRSSPPGFPVEDFQDAYSWTFAPPSVAK